MDRGTWHAVNRPRSGIRGAAWAAVVAAALLGMPNVQAAAAGAAQSQAGGLVVKVTTASTMTSLASSIGGSVVDALRPAIGSGWGACYGIQLVSGEPGGGTGGTCMCPSAQSLCPTGVEPDSSMVTIHTGTAPGLYTVHTVGELEILQDWRTYPTILTADGDVEVIQLRVQVANNGPSPMQDIVYRRGSHFWFENASPMEMAAMTVAADVPLGQLETAVRFSSANGYASNNPRAAFDATPNGSYACPDYAHGPGSDSTGAPFTDVQTGATPNCPSGAQVELLLGNLGPTSGLTFNMYYFAAPNEAAAADAVAILGADMHFLAQMDTPNGITSGAPVTFGWALSEIVQPRHYQWVCEQCGPDKRERTPEGQAQTPADADGDGVQDEADACPGVADNQADTDRDGQGDACDETPRGDPGAQPNNQATRASRPSLDVDLDGVADAADDCPTVPDGTQADLDRDGLGDACDADVDGDGVPQTVFLVGAIVDNCARTVNPGQADADHDGVGDACQGGAVVAAASPAPVQAAVGAANVRMDAATGTTTAAVALAALGAVAATVAVAPALRRGARGLPAFGLFSRIEPPGLVQHPTRAQILQLVEAQPGIHVHEVATRLERSRSDITHHVRQLERGGLLRSRPAGNRRELFAGAGPLPPQGPAPGAADQALAILRSEPGLPIAELAQRLGTTYGAAHYHARRLAEAGFVRLEESEGLLRAQLAA